MKDIRAIIFDFDGTLVDSYKAWAEFINPEFFAKIGAPIESKFAVPQELRGKSAIQFGEYLIEKYNLKVTAEQVVQKWVQSSLYYYNDMVEFKAGISEFIKLVSNRNIKVGIASNNFIEVIKSFLESKSSLDHFSVLVSQSDVNRVKPFPDIYLKASRELGVKPDNCLVFEDALDGVLAAKAAGMSVIGVYDEGHKQSENEIKKHCDRFINDFTEVLDIFENELAG